MTVAKMKFLVRWDRGYKVTEGLEEKTATRPKSTYMLESSLPPRPDKPIL